MLNHSTLLYSKGLPHKPGVRLLKDCEKGLDRETTHGVTIYFLAGCRIWQEFSRQKKQDTDFFSRSGIFFKVTALDFLQISNCFFLINIRNPGHAVYCKWCGFVTCTGHAHTIQPAKLWGLQPKKLGFGLQQKKLGSELEPKLSSGLQQKKARLRTSIKKSSAPNFYKKI